jgi:ABC-type glycerol-3-phosphate transport system permease component
MRASFLSGGYLFFHAAFASMSKEYAEAAKIDGATQLQLMVEIAIPLARTILLVQFVSAFISSWNDYQTPMIYLSSYPTAAYGLMLFTQSTNSYEDYLIYKLAGFMLLLIPTFTVFMFLKEYLLGEVTEGGVKE